MEDVTQISQMAQILNPKHSRTGTMCNMTMNAVDFEMLKQRELIPRVTWGQARCEVRRL